MLSSDFVFRGGVVGPLNKKDYCATMETLGVYRAFSLESNSYGFTVDDSDPFLVRFFHHNTGKQTAPWRPWGSFPPTSIPCTNKDVIGPTETGCVKFSSSDPTQIVFFNTGNVLQFGDVIDNNTGGLGAVLGLFHAVGYGDVGNIALIKLVRDVSNSIGYKTNAVPLTKSREEDIPSWYVE